MMDNPVAIISAVVTAGLLIWFLVEKRRRRTYAVTGGLHRDITLPHGQEFELYSNAFSHCSRKARLVFSELGLPHKHHAIDLIETGWYETISPGYLRVNPGGLLPTLLHNGHPVYESDDILAYAAAHAPEGAPSLVPDDAAAAAEMQHWIEYATLSEEGQAHSAGACIPGLTLPLFMTAIRYIPLRRILVGFLFHRMKERPLFFTLSKIFGLRRMLAFPPVKATMAAARDHMPTHLLALEAQLAKSGGPWILGENYTLADVSWSCLLLRLDETAWLDFFVERGALVEVPRYYASASARPGWQNAIVAVEHPIIVRASKDLKMALAGDVVVNNRLHGS